MSAMPAFTSPAWQVALATRGILDAALSAGWTGFTWFDTPGWAYPLYRSDGQAWVLPESAGVAAGRPAQRWKALDSQHKPKYMWGYPDQSRERGELRQPAGCAYYWLPREDVKAAIAADNGTLYLAAGEPDLLTLVENGKRNVTCFFGESQIPDTLLEVMTKLDVKRVVSYPNNDNTGWDTTQRLYALFASSGITFEAYALKYMVKDRVINDLNDLWCALEFAPPAFAYALERDVKPLSFLDAAESDPAPHTSAPDYDAYKQAVEDALVARGAKWRGDTGGWSKDMPCIFDNHSHDAKQPSAGYNRTSGVFRCFKCGSSWKRDEVAQRLGIQPPAPRPALTLLPKTAPASQSAPPAASAPRVQLFTSTQSLDRYAERLQGINPIEPIPFPLRSLHALGGFCRVVPLGKVIGVLGVSGGGKTSFVETMVDAWRQMGFHTLWWGPEWTWEEMADRAIQRYGGLTMMDMMLHELALSEIAAGVPEEQRVGVQQGDAAIAHTMNVLRGIQAWRGQAFYLDKMDVTMDALLANAQTYHDDLAAVGKRPKIAVFDYIQLAEIGGARGDGERIPRAISLIKAFCSDNRLVGVVGTQARKEDSENARERGDLLTAEAAQFFRDDKTNLFITLNPDYDHDGNMTGGGWINVVKNSGGRKARVQAQPDPAHLRWNDVIYRRPEGLQL
jgi:hypothetical protein